jgi:hypothetical protein
MEQENPFAFEQARAQVAAWLARRYRNMVVVDELTIERPFGWVFSMGSAQYAKTLDPKLRQFGDTTIIFNRHEGRIVLWNAENVFHKIATYEAMLEKRDQPERIEVVFWSIIKDRDRPDEFEDYLRWFPNGEFSALAREKLAALNRPEKRP